MDHELCYKYPDGPWHNKGFPCKAQIAKLNVWWVMTQCNQVQENGQCQLNEKWDQHAALVPGRQWGMVAF